MSIGLERETKDRIASVLAQAAVALGLVAVLAWPMAATAIEAFRGERGASVGAGLIDAAAFGQEAGLVAGPAVETLRVSGLTVAIALAVGVPLAVILFRTDAPGRRLVLMLMALALFEPMPLYAAGWLGGFANAGYLQAIGTEPILTGWPGAAFVHAMASVPWVVLLTGVGLLAVEPELEESSWLDLPAWRVVFGVTLRRSLGAIVASALVVAVLTSSDMTVTDMLLVRTYAEESYVQYGMGRPPEAVALVAIPPMVVLGALLLLSGRSLLRSAPARLASASARPRTWRLGRWRWPIGVASWAVVAAMLGPPLYALIWRAGRVSGEAGLAGEPSWSLDGLREALAYAIVEVRAPMAETATLAAIGATLTVVLAWSLAWLSRRPGPWRWIVVAGVALLLALPGPVAGMAMLLAYRLVPPIYDTPAILVLGYVQRTLAFALLVLWPAVRSIPVSFLESSALDGLGSWGRIRRIALPLTLGALMAAWGVSFVLAMGELPVTNMVYQAGSMPLPVFIWSQMHFGVDSRISGIGLVLLGLYALIGGLTVALVSRAYRWR